MYKQPFAWLAAATLTAGTAFAQDNPAPPPLPPQPPAAPGPHQGPPPPRPGEDAPPPPGHEEGDHHHGPGDMHHGPGDMHHEGGPGHHSEAGIMLGVGIEPVSRPLASQLNLPKGFGVGVNFVVPGSAAEAAGVQPDDVLKMLNDQILVNPEQLSTLVRSYADGQEVTLTAIRKGQEVKLKVKLKQQTVSPEDQERFHGPGGEKGFMHPGGDRPNRSRFEYRDAHADTEADDDDSDEDSVAPPAPPAPPVGDILRELRPELKQLGQAASQKVVSQLQHEITILREHDGASRHTKLDLEDARIIVRDDKGELELKSDAGRRSLTVKDPQGKTVFNGPVNTPDERKAVPAEILPRLDKLEKEELPTFPEAPNADGASLSPADLGLRAAARTAPVNSF